MTLRLDRDGKSVFDDWRSRCAAQDLADASVALGDVAHQRWERKYRAYRNPAEPDVTVIRVRHGLYMHVGLWAEDDGEFTLVEISEMAPEGIGDEE